MANRKRQIWVWSVLGLLVVCVAAAALGARALSRRVNLSGVVGPGHEGLVQVPPGFEVNVFASGLDEPRFISFGPNGVLHAADRGSGRIVALPDADGDGEADAVWVVAEDLGGVHSLEFRDGAWFVGVPSGVIRLEDADGDGVADIRRTLVDDYPTSGHSTRTVAFLPDGRMLVSVGSSCNVCREEDARRAAIVVYDGPAATGERLFATGLRNAVGLAIHPATGEVWATNNGRDMMGDDLPADEVVIVREGADYGWPACHNGYLVDPDFGFDGACRGKEKPLIAIQAHSAPLGLAFYTGSTFPEAYRGDLFIALHGSWNRSVPTGYKVVRVPMADNAPAGPTEDFAIGWLDEATGQAAGRPVGLAVGPDGALYVSDDKGGFIYRIRFAGPG